MRFVPQWAPARVPRCVHREAACTSSLLCTADRRTRWYKDSPMLCGVWDDMKTSMLFGVRVASLCCEAYEMNHPPDLTWWCSHRNGVTQCQLDGSWAINEHSSMCCLTSSKTVVSSVYGFFALGLLWPGGSICPHESVLRTAPSGIRMGRIHTAFFLDPEFIERDFCCLLWFLGDGFVEGVAHVCPHAFTVARPFPGSLPLYSDWLRKCLRAQSGHRSQICIYSMYKLYARSTLRRCPT